MTINKPQNSDIHETAQSVLNEAKSVAQIAASIESWMHQINTMVSERAKRIQVEKLSIASDIRIEKARVTADINASKGKAIAEINVAKAKAIAEINTAKGSKPLGTADNSNLYRPADHNKD